LFVIVNTDQPRLMSLVERQPGAVCVAERGGTRQYKLPHQSGAAPVYAIVGARPIVRVSASCPSAESAIDGDSGTRWICGPQRGAEWFVADLGAAAEGVGAVRYTMGEFYREFPRDLVIETSVDGEVWEPAWSG